MENSGITRTRKKFIRKDGILIWCMTSANLIYDEQDVAVRISLVIRDITRKEGMCTFLGIGFEADEAEKIFQTFARLHPKDLYDGTGLGLSLCRKIVERQGGMISASSEPGQGSEFTILLPA